MRIHVLLPIVALLGVAGCQTHLPEYLVTVSNQSQTPIRDVQIGYAGEIRGNAALVEPGAERGQLHPGHELGEGVSIRWKDAKGDAHEKVLEPERTLHAPFEGELYIQFTNDGDARLFVMHERKRAVSVLPWGQPAQWEQAPNIPGLDQQ